MEKFIEGALVLLITAASMVSYNTVMILLWKLIAVADKFLL